MLPGNSPKEMAVERAMEEAEEIVDGFLDDVRFAQMALWHAFDKDQSIDDAALQLRKASDKLEGIQAAIDDARNILGRVLDD